MALTRADVRAHIATLFRPSTDMRIGIEVETIPLCQTSTPTLMPHSQVADLVAELPPAEQKGISFEPAGQLEYSSIPHTHANSLVEATETTLGHLRSSLAGHNGILLHTGINPWHSPESIGLRTGKYRYEAMHAHFDRIGPYGARMMRQSTTIQVCLDHGPDQATTLQRYNLALKLAPIAAATFANAPYVDSKRAPVRSMRTLAWRHLDPARTGFPSPAPTFEGMIDAYANFLLAAPIIPVNPSMAAAPQGNFSDWLSFSNPPTIEDLNTALSLLFPEVRPKGFLELRYVDGLDRAWLWAPVGYLTALLYTDLTALENLLTPVQDPHAWMVRATQGLEDSSLSDLARQTMRLALDQYSQLPERLQDPTIFTVLARFAAHYTFKNRTPADELIEATAPHIVPDLATFSRLQERWRQLP